VPFAPSAQQHSGKWVHVSSAAASTAGLPQGSPLSPILFLFFNADLVQSAINDRGGAIAFMDDYPAWYRPSPEANYAGIQQTVDRVIQWEKKAATLRAQNKYGDTYKNNSSIGAHSSDNKGKHYLNQRQRSRGYHGFRTPI